MLLRQNDDGEVVLYDDHGQAWVTALEAESNEVPGGSLTASTPSRTIRFVGGDGELLRIRYRGRATEPPELGLDETVTHFLDAQDR